MIIVCLVLVVAAFVVIGVALALAELTLVNIALGLGGLAAVLLAVEFVRNRRTLFGQGRTESLPDHRSALLHGAVAGQVRTDGLGKASVQPPGTAAATGQVAPTAAAGGPPVAVQGIGDTTAVAETPVPAPVSEPVRAVPAQPSAAETEDLGAGGADNTEAEPHGSTAVDSPEDGTEAVGTEDDSEEAASRTAADDDGAVAVEDTDSDEDVAEQPRTGSSAVDEAAEEEDTGAAASPDADAIRTLPVPVGEPHGSTAVEDSDRDSAEEAAEERADEAADAEPEERDGSADAGQPDTTEVPEADTDPHGTASGDEVGPEAGTAGHDGSEDADTAETDDGPDAHDEADAIAFREPAEWNPPFALPSKEQSEDKNVSAAAIAELAARWTPTGGDLAADPARDSDGDRPTDPGGDSPAVGTPHGSTAVPGDSQD